MPVDIEYPIPNDEVGHVFRAGGDYSSSRKGVLPSGSKVVSKVLSSSSAPLSTKEYDLSGKPESGFWEVEHSVQPNTSEHLDCSVTAELIIGGSTDGSDTVENVDIKNVAQGVVNVIP